MASERLPTRERRPSMGAPIVDIQGAVGPAGISRPKHKRTVTGFGASDIKSVEGSYPLSSLFLSLHALKLPRAHGYWVPEELLPRVSRWNAQSCR